MTPRPYAESCDQNKDPIHRVIKPYLQPGFEILEIASGTGQHAVHFARLNPHITWQASDKAENLPGIQTWLDYAQLPNLCSPIALDVRGEWPNKSFDLVFSANSLHIMGDSEAELCIRGAAQCLKPGGHFIVYGPFNYNGDFTSESNRRFEQWLKQNNPRSGIKHFEVVNDIADQSGLQLVDDVAMPANNRILIWQRGTLTNN